MGVKNSWSFATCEFGFDAVTGSSINAASHTGGHWIDIGRYRFQTVVFCLKTKETKFKIALFNLESRPNVYLCG